MIIFGIKLCKSFFGIQEDIYLCYLYNPPENSLYSQSLETDIFEIIENDIVNYSEKGKNIDHGGLKFLLITKSMIVISLFLMTTLLILIL
jgi:hypothetical protein